LLQNAKVMVMNEINASADTAPTPRTGGRSRTNPVLLYFSDEELDLLNTMMKEAGTDSRAYLIRKMIFDGCIIKVDFTKLNWIITQLSKIGTNFNQVARRANEVSAVGEEDIRWLRKQFEEVAPALEKVLEKIINM